MTRPDVEGWKEVLKRHREEYAGQWGEHTIEVDTSVFAALLAYVDELEALLRDVRFSHQECLCKVDKHRIDALLGGREEG